MRALSEVLDKKTMKNNYDPGKAVKGSVVLQGGSDLKPFN